MPKMFLNLEVNSSITIANCSIITMDTERRLLSSFCIYDNNIINVKLNLRSYFYLTIINLHFKQVATTMTRLFINTKKIENNLIWRTL